MKTKKNKLLMQRQIIEKKLENWRRLKNEKTPPSGWIKSIRGALGMTTYQLARRMGVSQAATIGYEKREAEGGITIGKLSDAAEAMDCKLIYAIVPKDQYSSLTEIIDKHAIDFAYKILNRTEHTMKLEKQGSGSSKSDLKKMVEELKSDVDSRIWDKG